MNDVVAQPIVEAACRVHTALGPGLLEIRLPGGLACELEKRGLRISRQQVIPVVYETVRIHTGFHADLVVEERSWRSRRWRASRRCIKTAPPVSEAR
jgi:GxxExxY protein